MDSYNNKRQRIYDSVPNSKLSDDTMCNENTAGVENQSSDHCTSKFDNPEEGNTAYEDCQQIYRDVNQFKVGQIWALYDKRDVMPRLYAKIIHSDAHNHKIHLIWLEHDAKNKEEEKWTEKKLPVACGSFRLQPTVDTSQDRFKCSHNVAWTKGKKRYSYDIYPNKGEVWALYKGWSMQWSSDTDNHRSYEYEVVEVLSTMSAAEGATVIPLVKIKGFVSLFARAKGMSSIFIPSSELLRFSRSISFYRTNGNEKNGVPRDFLELDTACLPADLDATFFSVTLVSYMFLGNMAGCVFADLTTESADNKIDCEDESVSGKENPLGQIVCHSISKDDKDDISSDQNTSEQIKAHDAHELGQEDTPTVPNAAESCDLQMLSKRKHDHYGDRRHRKDSCINMRESKDNSPSHANSTGDKIYNDDVAVVNNQAAKHVPDTMDSQGEGNATHEGSQQKFKEKATDIANHTHGNPGIAYECTGSIRRRDSCSNDRQRKDNSLADVSATDDKVCSDNVAGGENQAIEPVPITLDSQDKGSATQEGIQYVVNLFPAYLTTESADNKTDCGNEQVVQKENPSEPLAWHSISTYDTDDICSEQNTSTQKTAYGATESGDSSQQNCPSPNSNSLYPYSDFHDFEEGRSCKKFKHGQIWAIYSDAHKFPNFYAWVRKVDTKPFRVHLTWLEACPDSEQEKWWLEQDISISCGTFEVRNWSEEYDTSWCFSHLVDARPTGMKWQFEVVPQVGQIWATYMDWAPGWVPPSDGACEYVIGKIIECTEAGTKLTALTQVGGYMCVFKPDNTKGVLEIPAGENLRFSHRIPSFRLTEERGGTLRGFYELDPASLPDAFLYRDT